MTNAHADHPSCSLSLRVDVTTPTALGKQKLPWELPDLHQPKQQGLAKLTIKTASAGMAAEVGKAQVRSASCSTASRDHKNHRMVGVGRDLCGSSSPTPLPKQGHLNRLHRTLCRRVLNISREGDSTTSLGSLGQGSVTLRVKKFFLMFRPKSILMH